MSNKTIIKLIVPIFSIIIFLFILELFFRVRGAFPSYLNFSHNQFYNLKNTTKILYPPSKKFFDMKDEKRPCLSDKNYRVMNLDLRDYNYPIKKKKDTFRVLGMGDSFAWGWGVFDNRLSMFKLLEYWFNVMKKDVSNIDVINCAQPGAGIEFYDKFIREHAFNLEPDMIMLVWNLNDIRCYHASVPDEAHAYSMIQKKPGWLSQHSMLFKFLQYRYYKKLSSEYTIKDYHASYFGAKKSLWEDTKKMLININQSCKKKKITFLFVIFPLLNDLDKHSYPFAREVSEIETFAHKNGIRVHNLLPDFINKKASLLWVLPADAHPNEIAHRIAAESIYYYCKSNKLVPIQDWKK